MIFFIEYMEQDLTGKIRINQYDSGEIDVSEICDLEEGDVAYFSVYTFDDAFKDGFITKQATKENPKIELTEEDTSKCPGRYRYQVKVQKSDGRVFTARGETRFDILR